MSRPIALKLILIKSLHKISLSFIFPFLALLVLLTPLATLAHWICIPQQESKPQVLEPGKPIERELAGDSAHSYSLTLTAGQFCQAVIDQRGIDVVVALYDANGKRMVQVDSPNETNGPEQVSLVADVSSTYRLEVRSPNKNARAGRYELKIVEWRPATQLDQSRLAAQRAYVDAKSLRNLRTAESQRQAIEKYKEAIALWRTVRDLGMEAYSLHDMGWIYGDLGEYQEALDAYAKAREIFKMMRNPRGESGVLSNMSSIYSALGEHQRAITFQEQSLQICRNLGDCPDEPRLLNNIAVDYARLGDYKKALGIHLQVLPLRRAGNDFGGQAITLNNIANCYDHLGEKQKALDYYGQALALMPAVANAFYTATTLNNLGRVYRDLSDVNKALDYFTQALLARRTVGDLNGEAATLADMARLERDRGQLVEARQHIESALAAVESLRANVSSPQLRASFFASVRRYHELNIDLLMRLHHQRPSEGFDALALQASEKARARSLLELLAEARAQIHEGVDQRLLERERSLRQSIGDKAAQQTRMLSRKHTEEQATQAAKEIDALTIEYEEVQVRIRQTSPRYSKLIQPSPLTLAEIQKQVLDDETVLLEYSLGDERSFLWMVTPTAIRAFELPKRADIEMAARRLFETLTARNRFVQNETPSQRRERVEQADAEYTNASAALSQMLLGPVASDLGKSRLLVVGDGMLQYVPFAALPEPLPKASETPIIERHEIINLASASVLAVLRQEITERKTTEGTIAVFADPVFQSSDPRVRSLEKSHTPVSQEIAGGDIKRSITEAGLDNLIRLRFSRQEASRIVSLAPAGKKLEAVDFAANRIAATSPDLRNYSIVHFATHGLINNQNPELSGVVLSLVDEQGRPQNGFLRLYDIYNLKLGADLVVLSACQTALGKEIKGEGLVGLTRGFMYAGSPRVVASLWQIDDRVTAELMTRFYEAMWRDHLRPAAALRAAQISMWKDKRWRTPYNWAAFTFQGEWQ